MIDESKAVGLMAAGNKCLENGQSRQALQLFRIATEIGEQDRRHARFFAAIAKVRCNQFAEARKDLEALLSDTGTTPEGTVFRADVLRWLCAVRLIQEETEGTEPLLKEAADIYKHQGVLAPLGEVIHLQGQVAGLKTEVEKMDDMFDWGIKYAQINVPGIVPFSIGVDLPFEPPTRETALTEAALVGSRS